MRVFHENPNRIHTELTFINPKIAYHKQLYVLSTAELFKTSKTNNVDPDQTASVGAV